MRKVWFYNPPENKALATIEAVAADTDVICLTMGLEREQWARDLKKAGFNGGIWLYWLQNSVHMIDQPNRNNVGYIPGTFDNLKQNYPDIFQRHLNGEIVRKNLKLDYAVCDIAHPEWRNLFLDRTRATVGRNEDLWSGVWLDDLNVVFYVNSVKLVETLKYGKASSEEYFAALLDYLIYQRDEVSAPLGLKFGGNLQGSDLARWKTTVDIMAKNNGFGSGVVMNEHQFLTHEGEYLSLEEWKDDLQKVEIATKAGAEVWNICPVDAKEAYENPLGVEMEKVNFFCASHLLVADPVTSAVRIGRHYKDWYPFDLKSISKRLGKAKGVYKVIGKTYSRSFEGGLVIVEPDRKKARIEYVPVVEPPSDLTTITITGQNLKITYS